MSRDEELSVLTWYHLITDTIQLGWKFLSCSYVKSCVYFLFLLLIGCSLLCSQSGASLLVDTTLDIDYSS